MNAVATCGLQLYSFGETVSIPFWEETWKPASFFDKIISNRKSGLHTLCLLDIKVKEKSLEALMKGRDVYEPPRFMSTAVASEQILAIIEGVESDDKEKAQVDRAEWSKLLNANSLCVGLARVGSDSQIIRTCSIKEMAQVDLGEPLHSLVIPGNLHPLEEEMLNLFKQ